MNFAIKLLIAASVAVLTVLTTPAPARADLIVNGGFETGDLPERWRAPPDGAFALVDPT
jgi:hypothetical protein